MSQTRIKTARLGTAGPAITRLGVGSWSWSPGNDDDTVAVIQRAIEGGVDWVDTAPVYSLGRSEELVGRAVAPYRDDEVRVFTKCGLTWDDPAAASIKYDLRPESIRLECEHSLRRLGRSHIDLYQIHWPDYSGVTEIEDAWGTMVELQQEGKVSWIGVSNFTVDLLDRCEAIRHVDSIQQPLSIFQRAALETILPWTMQYGTGVLAYSPMASGLLSGAFDRARAEALTASDFRSLDPNFCEPRLTANLELLDRLRTAAERLDCSLIEVALGWVFSLAGVTAAIVGGRVPSQVDEWIAAPSVELTPADVEEIRAAIEETGAGDMQTGPRPPNLETLGVAE